MVLAADRNTKRRDGVERNHPVAAASVIYGGGITVLNAAGDAAPATAAVGLTVVGIAQARVDNSAGGAGDKTVPVRSGDEFLLKNGEAITNANVGDTAFAVDDESVGITATGRSPVGIITAVESAGVWVYVPRRMTPLAAIANTTGAALAALETEVNNVKAALRNAGIIAP